MTEHTNHYYYSFEQEGNFSYSAEDIDQLSEYEKYQLSFHPERPNGYPDLMLYDLDKPIKILIDFIYIVYYIVNYPFILSAQNILIIFHYLILLKNVFPAMNSAPG